MNEVIFKIILQLAVIILLTNIIRPLFLKIKFPPVIGLILLGIVLGPSLLNLSENTLIIRWISEAGVLFLMFNAGIEMNLNRLKKESVQAIFPAIGGIIIPLISGFSLSMIYGYSFVSSVLVGTIFTATSISVSLMTLIDVNKFNSIEGRCIVNSAIIDDIICIIIISLVFSISLHTGTGDYFIHKTLIISMLKIIMFFVVSYLVGRYIILNIILNIRRLSMDNAILSLVVALIFMFAWFAELLGLAALTGAFICGLIMGQTDYKDSVFTGINNLGRCLFIDIFFVSIGLGLNLKALNFKPLFQVLFILIAIFSKVLGSLIGALISRFGFTRALRIGIGMVPRGEVALIISFMAYHNNLIDIDILSTTIIMVIITSIATPILIKYSYSLTYKNTFRLKTED